MAILKVELPTNMTDILQLLEEWADCIDANITKLEKEVIPEVIANKTDAANSIRNLAKELKGRSRERLNQYRLRRLKP
jgi:hypothetical protein